VHRPRAAGVPLDEIWERVAGCVAVADELRVAELEQLDATPERGPGRRPGQIGDRERGVGARIAGLPAVQIGFDEVLRLVAGREHEVGVEFGAEHDPVQLVRRCRRFALDADDL
jgi:hypothetical protein